MRVLVTGANGHIGTNLVRELLGRNHDVVAFVRKTSDLRGLDGLDVSYAYGDVMELETLIPAAEGCDAIAHLAAVYHLWAKHEDEILAPALVGTRNIYQAARDAGVQRLVFTSSVAAIGATRDRGKVLTADDWNEDPHLPYVAAKTRSERSAWQLAEQYNVPTISLCPGVVLGPYAYHITPSMEVLRGYANGTDRTYNSGISGVDVRDVATIHALALEKGTPGKRYPVTTKICSFRELAQMVSELTGKKVAHWDAGPRIGKMLAVVMELGAKITGGEPQLTRAMVDEFAQRYQYVDGTPTYEAFGYTPYEFSDTIRDSLIWLAKIGALVPDVAARIGKL